MKRVLALALVFAVIGLGVPTPTFAARGQQPDGSIAGDVKDQGGSPVANHTVRVRNAGTGQVAGNGSTNVAGRFSFGNLGQATYVVEAVDETGRIQATSTAVTLATGAMTNPNVAIVLSQSGTGATAAAAGSTSFFKSTAGILLLVAGGALAVGGIVVATNDDTPKSPSK